MIPRSIRILAAAATLSFIPGQAEGQIGPLIDWIHKMSGPQFWGVELSGTIGYRPGQFLPRNTAATFAYLQRQGAFRAVSGRTSTPMDAAVGSADGCFVFPALLLDDEAMREFAFDERDVDRLRRWIPSDTTSGRQLELFTENACPISLLAVRALADVDPFGGFFGRVSGTVGLDQQPLEDDTYSIWAVTVQPTIGYAVRLGRCACFSPTLEVESGITVHHYSISEPRGAEDVESFWHVSFPILIGMKPFGWNESRLWRALRFGGGVRIFPPFPEGAFDPLFAGDTELGKTIMKATFFVGFDFTVGS